jgi:hypothetical protein
VLPFTFRRLTMSDHEAKRERAVFWLTRFIGESEGTDKKRAQDALDLIHSFESGITEAWRSFPSSFVRTHGHKPLHEVILLLREYLKYEESLRDSAYRERNLVIRALCKLFPSYRSTHVAASPGEEWEDEWRNVVFIDLPTGQVSWHIHDSELPIFEDLQYLPNNWDGHDTEEKYNRLDALPKMEPHLTTAADDACFHEWVSADNEVVSGAAICKKCHKVVPVTSLPEDVQKQILGEDFT